MKRFGPKFMPCGCTDLTGGKTGEGGESVLWRYVLWTVAAVAVEAKGVVVGNAGGVIVGRIAVGVVRVLLSVQDVLQLYAELVQPVGWARST